VVVQGIIHPEIFRLVRKKDIEAKIEPKELSGIVKEYIDTLNAGHDFITPAYDLDVDIIKAQKISDDF